MGSHVVDALLAEGHQVVIVDNLQSGDERNINPSATFYQKDIRDPDIRDVLVSEQCEAVCHLAAKTNMRESLADPFTDIDHNIIGLVRLLEACKDLPIKRFVFSSTGGALYGNTETLPATEDVPPAPISPYGISKMAGERYLYSYHERFALPITILRYSNVFGPRLDRKKGGASATMRLLLELKAGKQPHITGDGEQTRDFVYVKDVARANALAVEEKNSEGVSVYNIGSGRETSINALLVELGKALDVPVNAQYIDPIAGEVTRSCLSIERASTGLGWKPAYSLEKGIEEMTASVSADSGNGA